MTELLDQQSLRIFVVEDDDVYRELLAFALSSHGHEVFVAENGARAVELIGHAEPDIIVLDMLMPVMDGLTFLHWLRDESKDETPVLVLTCIDDRAFVVDALVAGANDVVIKPVNLKTLISKTHALVDDHVSSATGSVDDGADDDTEDPDN